MRVRTLYSKANWWCWYALHWIMGRLGWVSVRTYAEVVTAHRALLDEHAQLMKLLFHDNRTIQ